MELHPRGKNANILLTSVFGPYAQDDEFGSRRINPMELWHNQVTRMDGPFSIRMHHRSFNLMMLQANLDAPCTLLDFPTMDQFIREIRSNSYDIVGIGSIVMNILKVKKMCELVREYLPNAVIVVGGHIASVPDLAQRIDADHIVKGDGIRWLRSYVGDDAERPIRHPVTQSHFGARVFGISSSPLPQMPSAVVIPSVGCPFGCNFCSTSALFGGKGNHVEFYKTGDELYSIMDQIAEKLGVRIFFIQDENFLLNKARAMRLLELMETHAKSWSLFVFTSARVLQGYSIEEMLGLGITWVWLGLEGENSEYNKLNGVDTRSLVHTLRSHGIRVLGSTIIGLEEHSPENIDEVIDWAVSHNTDFHQFMLYMPLPGTPLYQDFKVRGLMKNEDVFSPADFHGQFRFNYRHGNINDGEEEQFLLDAFCRDRDVNGPALTRMMGTLLKSYVRYKDHPNPRIRNRIVWETKPFYHAYAGILWAAVRYFRVRGNHGVAGKLSAILDDVYKHFGWRAKLAAPIAGMITYALLLREERRLSKGITYEPSLIREKNERAMPEKRFGFAFFTKSYSQISWVSVER